MHQKMSQYVHDRKVKINPQRYCTDAKEVSQQYSEDTQEVYKIYARNIQESFVSECYDLIYISCLFEEKFKTNLVIESKLYYDISYRSFDNYLGFEIILMSLIQWERKKITITKPSQQMFRSIQYILEVMLSSNEIIFMLFNFSKMMQ